MQPIEIDLPTGAVASTNTTSAPGIEPAQSLANAIVPAAPSNDLIKDFDLIHIGNGSYTSCELAALTNPNTPQRSDRGTVRTTKTPTPFKELCDRLWRGDTTDLHGVLFEVKSEN